MSGADVKARALELRETLFAIARDHDASGAVHVGADYREAARMLGELSAELGRARVFRDRARRERDEWRAATVAARDALERAQAERDAARADAESVAALGRGLRAALRETQAERDAARDTRDEHYQKIVDARRILLGAVN